MDRFRAELIANAKRIATPGKGILAADESTGTIAKRFESIKLENTEENRRAYRELLFTTEGMEEYISGVIMYDETIHQKTADGVPFVEVLAKKGVLTGIKVDKGVKPLRGTNEETFTQGFDDLDVRCKKYYELGARFAKWRAVLKISKDGCPSPLSVEENTRGLARYAAICQDNGLVPIVEPEILMDGDHSIETSVKVTQHVLAATYKALHDANVLLEGTLLKPNMVLNGLSNKQVTPEEVAHATLTVLLRTVPAAVPGINFLSGGQSEEEATLNLNAMNKLQVTRPWTVSFSYGRALQATCIKTWKGQKENVEAAKAVFLQRAQANGQATLGKYAGGVGGESATQSLFVENYAY
jgi:fructose-bisphosphate aldolase class I